MLPGRLPLLLIQRAVLVGVEPPQHVRVTLVLVTALHPPAELATLVRLQRGHEVVKTAGVHELPLVTKLALAGDDLPQAIEVGVVAGHGVDELPTHQGDAFLIEPRVLAAVMTQLGVELRLRRVQIELAGHELRHGLVALSLRGLVPGMQIARQEEHVEEHRRGQGQDHQ